MRWWVVRSLSLMALGFPSSVLLRADELIQ